MAFLRQQDPILSKPVPFSPEETSSLIAASRRPLLLAEIIKGEAVKDMPEKDTGQAIRDWLTQKLGNPVMPSKEKREIEELDREEEEFRKRSQGA